MKINRSILVVVSITITILVGCKSSKVIIPETFVLEKHFGDLPVAIFPIDLTDLNSSTLKRVMDRHKDEIIFSNFVFESDNFVNKFPDNPMWAVIYQIKTVTTSEEIISLIKKKSGELPGNLGLILAWEQGRDLFPMDSTNRIKRYVVGFNKKPSKLWEGYGKSHGVMCVSKHSDEDGWLFDAGCYEHNWYSNYYVLFFVPEKNMGEIFPDQH